MNARRIARLVVAAALAATAVAAQAQTYRCVQGGSIVYSNRPCDNGGKFGMYGPTQSASPGMRERPGYVAPAPIAPPPELTAYMSPRCNQIREALTSAQRTTNAEVQRGLLMEWRSARCTEDAQEALGAVMKKRLEERESKRQQMVAEQTTERMNAQQTEQCAEMRRILAAKRKRTDLNDGERADLQRFEGVYTERCGAR